MLCVGVWCVVCYVCGVLCGVCCLLVVFDGCSASSCCVCVVCRLRVVWRVLDLCFTLFIVSCCS